MYKLFSAVAPLLAVILSGPAFADELIVSAQQEPVVSASPREVLTLSFRLQSLFNREIQVNPSLDCPAGWSPMVPISPVRLAPGGSAVVLAHLRLPALAAVGHHQLRLRLRSPEGDTLTRDVFTTIVVRANLSIGLEVLEVPTWVVAGQEIPLRLWVINRSNIVQTFPVVVETRPQSPKVDIAPAIEMAPGEGKELGLTIRTATELAREHYQSVVIRLLHGSETVARVATGVRVVPRSAAGRSNFESIPADLSLALMNNQLNGGATMQLAARGAGNFGPEGRHRVAFHLIGPSDTTQASSLGRRDEYSLSYSDANLQLELGDGGFFLSPLVEQGRWGRGARAQLQGHRWSVGGFIMGDRSSDLEEYALFAELRPTSSTGVTLSLLEKRESTTRRLASACFRLINESLHAELEIARNLNSDTAGAGGYRASVGGQRGRLTFDLESFRTDPGFHGHFTDRELDHLRLSFAVNPKSRIWASFRHDQSTKSVAEPTHSAPETEELRIAAERYLGEFRVTLSAHSRALRDRRNQPSYSTRRRSAAVSLGLSRSIGKLHLRASWEHGELEDLLSRRSESSQYASFYASWHPVEHSSAYVNARYEENYFQLDDRDLSFAVGGATKLTANLELHGEAQYLIDRSGPEAVEHRQRFLQFSADWDNPWGHTVRLMIREGPRDPRPAVLLTYSVPFRFPVRRRTDLGNIKGRVVEQSSKRGVPDAVVSIAGMAVVSDRHGRFAFHGLPVGAHQLLVDLGPRGVSWTVLGTPQKIVVASRCNADVLVELAPSATIRGRVERWQTPAGDLFRISGSQEVQPQAPELVLTGGVGQVLLSLHNRDITIHRLSKPDGRFEFSGIPHGRWRLSVKTDQLPPYTKVEMAGTTVEVGAGGEKEINIRVVPKLRGIKLQRGGTLKVKGKTGLELPQDGNLG